MFKIFNYVNNFKKIKEGIEKPEVFASDTVFGVFEGYVMTSFIILGLCLLGSFWAGFLEGILFFKIIFFIVLIMILLTLLIFSVIKKNISRVLKNLASRIKKKEEKNS